MACECALGQLGRFLMFLLLVGGCVCGFLAASSCEFFSYTDAQTPTSLPLPYRNVTDASVGIFGRFDKKGNCETYDSNFMDAKDIFNAYWITAQWSAVLGPVVAALAWIVNLVEWLFWSHTATYLLVILLLVVAFGAQGLTFMIYGQREFCYDDDIAGDCSLEFGGYMSIAATGAFYVAAIVWCCMPRTPPFCIAPAKTNNPTSVQLSQDYNEFYGANTVADMLEYKESNQNQPPVELEPVSVYDMGAAEPTSPWADSQNRAPIPKQQPQQRYYSGGGPNEGDASSVPPGFYPADDPKFGFQEPSDPAWTPSASGADPFSSGTTPMQHAEFDNPFLIDDSLPPTDPTSRPAYGNLQG